MFFQFKSPKYYLPLVAILCLPTALLFEWVDGILGKGLVIMLVGTTGGIITGLRCVYACKNAPPLDLEISMVNTIKDGQACHRSCTTMSGWSRVGWLLSYLWSLKVIFYPATQAAQLAREGGPVGFMVPCYFFFFCYLCITFSPKYWRDSPSPPPPGDISPDDSKDNGVVVPFRRPDGS